MANLIATADGAWLTASTWGQVEAGASAAQTTRSSSTNTTTSYVYSSAFTCTNLDVMDGVLVHCKRLNTTGTVSVSLSEDNGTTATREVTINASDLPADQAWVFFKFASTLTADGGADYKVGVKGSSAANATFYRDGTAGNWARLVRLTSTAAPAAGDNTYIAKEWTAEGTGTARTVTMDALASSITDHGTHDIGQGGTLTFGASASTNYYLRLSGDLNIWDGGTLNIGTTGTPMPSTSTAKLNMDSGSNVQYGVIVNNGGTFNAQGASKTVSTFLAADAAVNATSLTTADSTSWADNDEIAIASTTRTATQCEKGALNGAASGTTLTVDGFGGAGGGVAFAHSGTAPTRAEIINLTRNVQIFGASATLQTYITLHNTATADWDYIECFWMGSATTNKRGIDVLTTTGTSNIQYCSMHDFSVANSISVFVSGAAANNFTISNNVCYSSPGHIYVNAATSGTSWTVSNNIAIRATAAYCFHLGDTGGTFSGNTAVGAVLQGINIDDTTSFSFSNLTSHSNGSDGIIISSASTGSTLTTITVWRNTGDGVDINTTSGVGLTISTITAFGNTTNNILCTTSVLRLDITGATLNGDSSFATTNGIGFPSAQTVFPVVFLDSSDLGTVSGIKTAHTNDINIGSGVYVALTGRNTKVASGTAINGLASAGVGSYVRIQKYGQTAGDHRAHFRHGIIKTDSTSGMYRTASPSERLTPSSASTKLESGPKRKIVNNSGTATFSTYVRASVSGDGAAHNGNRPRLVLRKNAAAGISSDTVLATATAASEGAFELLTGTSASVTDDCVLEAFVDTDGTAGWVNVDDWS